MCMCVCRLACARADTLGAPVVLLCLRQRLRIEREARPESAQSSGLGRAPTWVRRGRGLGPRRANPAELRGPPATFPYARVCVDTNPSETREPKLRSGS